MNISTIDKKKDTQHIHHDDPAHNEKLRQLNKGNYDYNTKANYAQITYDKKEHTEKCHKNLNMDKEKNYENQNNQSQERLDDKKSYIPGSVNAKNKDEDFNTDETTMNKNERDFEKVPSEREKFNKKVNKRMNKMDEKKDINSVEKIQLIQNKTKVLFSGGFETKEVLPKF
jgi:hypothetical protein